MPRMGWTKIAVAASLLISGAIIAAPPSASADSQPPPPVINMSNVPNQYLGAVQAFENNAVSEVLADHDLPASDTNAVLGWGRDDVRAQEWEDLDAIMSEDASKRSANDQLVFNWFQGVDKQQQIAAAQDAINEYLKWSGHSSIDDASAPVAQFPDGKGGYTGGYCNYEPPGGETGPFKGTYTDNQDQECFTPCTDLVSDCTPDYPTVDQFEQWGLYDADEQVTNTADFYGASVGTSVAMGIGVTAASASVELPFGTAIDASALGGTQLQEAIFPYAARVGYWAAQALSRGVTTASLVSDVAPEAAAGAELAGAIAFVAGVAIFFVISTVLASITLAQNAAVHTDLSDALTQAQNTAPDLFAQAKTTSGAAAMYSTFIGTTLPEADEGCTSGGGLVGSDDGNGDPCANAPAIPAPSASDPSFLVTANGTTTLQRSINSIDPGTFDDSTYMSGNGWFVTQKFLPGDPTDGGGTVQSLSFYYTDWSGNHWAAERTVVDGQPQFLVTPLDQSNESACAIPAGATTSPCLRTAIQFQEPNGSNPINATAELVPASATSPTAAASFPGTITAGQAVTLTATGSDPNNLPLTYKWELPSQWNNSSITCPGSGPCDTTLSGASPSYTFTLPGVYQGTLQVTDSAGFTSTEDFSVTVTGSTLTGVSSSANPSVYGQPVTFTADVAPVLTGNNGAFFYPKVQGYVQFLLGDTAIGDPVALQPSPGCGSPCPVPDGTATLTIPQLPVTALKAQGDDVTAQYLGSSQYGASSGDLGSPLQKVTQASTTTTVTSSANPAVTGQEIDFKASVAPVSPGGGLPTGTVQFQYDGQNIGGPVALDSTGTATAPPYFPPHALQGGLMIGPDMTATYSGDNNFTGSQGSLNQVVDTSPTLTSVQSESNPSNYRQSVTFTALVDTQAPGSGIPTGQVQFSVDGSPVGNPVNLDAAGTATLTTGTLARTGPGTSFPDGHTVTAQYLGDQCNGCIYFVPDYGLSTGGLYPYQEVDSAQLTITASSPTVTYGDPVPAITPGYSGFEAGDTAASLTTPATCTTTYQQGNGAGSYPATCSGAADSNYQIGYASGTVTVQPATLTVTAKNASMTAGGSPPAYGFTLSGFIGSDGSSALSAQPVCVADDPATGNPVSSSTPAGSYPITCSGATAANYTFAYVAGTLTVSRNVTTTQYTGGQSVLPGSPLTAQAQVSSSAGACASGQTVTFSTDRNPATGAAGSYQIGTSTTTAGVASATIATIGWQPGVYTLTASTQANGACGASAATASLTVGTAGKAAAGLGAYTLPGAGKATFSLLVGAVPHSTTAAAIGVLTWSTSQWQFAATVSRYVISGNAGSVTGTGLLYWWNPALNKGRGDWQPAKSGVAYTVSFTGTVLGKNASRGTFGITIDYTPTATQPLLSEVLPQALTSGAVGGT